MKYEGIQLGPLGLAAVFGAASVFLGGCAAEVRERPVVVADQPAVVVEAPADIETYPQVYYRGSVAYYVGERWYYRTPAGFVVFRREPIELARYRTAFRTRVRVY